jgi:hypothetical protein
MKDCFFLVADKQMEATFDGFLKRDDFHHRLRTSHFTFEIGVDYAGNDAGIYTRAHEILRVVHREFQHAVVALDHAWQGAPAPQKIRETIKNNLTRNGWHKDNVEVVVIEPELEIWLWTPAIAQDLGLDQNLFVSLRETLAEKGLWQLGTLKPARPKEAFELLCKNIRKPRSGALYSRITSRIFVNRCNDPTFCLLRDTLQRWFPNNGDQI